MHLHPGMLKALSQTEIQKSTAGNSDSQGKRQTPAGKFRWNATGVSSHLEIQRKWTSFNTLSSVPSRIIWTLNPNTKATIWNINLSTFSEKNEYSDPCIRNLGHLNKPDVEILLFNLRMSAKLAQGDQLETNWCSLLSRSINLGLF